MINAIERIANTAEANSGLLLLAGVPTLVWEGYSGSKYSVYAALGSVTTLLFFMYVAGRIVVTAPILNCSLHEELRGRTPP